MDDGLTECLGAQMMGEPPPRPDEAVELVELATGIVEAVADNPRTVAVLGLRADGHTYESIGKAIGVSNSRANQIHQRILRRLSSQPLRVVLLGLGLEPHQLDHWRHDWLEPVARTW